MLVVMTKDEQRPTDPLTASDAAQIMSQFQALKDILIQEMQAINGRIDGIAREQENIRSNINYFSADFQLSRETRNKMEKTGLQKEREILKQRLGIVDEQLKLKEEEKLTESQKMRAIAAESWQDREAREKADREKWWRDTLQAAARKIIEALSVGAALGLLAFLWWLFQLWVNR